MIHYIYKTTNLINGKIYIGVKTNSRHFDDGYFGSGTVLNRAIKKHGIQNFKKEVLWNFATPEECFNKEKEIVTEDFVKKSDTYNVALGGRGGNLGEEINLKKSKILQGHSTTDECRKKISAAMEGNKIRLGAKHRPESIEKIKKTRKENGLSIGEKNPMFGKKHSEETRQKMRKPHKSTGPKTRLSCVFCKKETTVTAFWHHKDCN